MSPEDVVLCQQAVALASSGKKQDAYEQFRLVYNHGNSEDITLLYWLAVTTPNLKEARNAIDTIRRLEPDHPELHSLQSYVARKEEIEKQRQRQEATEEKRRQKEAVAIEQSPILRMQNNPLQPEQVTINTRSGCKTFLIIALAVAAGIVVAVFILALFVSHGQNSPPYPWSLTINSGYSRETTLLGVPVGATKYVELHITLTNVSASDALSPNDLVWTLTDTSTNESYQGTMGGNVPALILPGNSSAISLDFKVPIASDVFKLSLSGPAGSDPTTWSVRFSV